MKVGVRRTIFALLSVLVAGTFPLTASAAEARSLFLEHLSTLDGLPQGSVFSTLQDSQGFVWFATQDGLVRYDGHDLHRYAYSPRAKEGLPGNFVFALAEDKHADLWLALKGSGVARWNRNSDTFTVFRHDKINPQSLSSDFVRTLMIDSHDRVWIGTFDAGVDVLDPKTGLVQHLDDRSSTAGLVDNQVYALMEDQRGEVWIGTDAGVDRWRLDGKLFTRSPYLAPGQRLLAGQQVRQFAASADGTIWVATLGAGLFHLEYSGRAIENLRHIKGHADSIASDEVHALLDDQNGHLWVGTAEGLDYLGANGRVSHFVHDKTDPSSLSDSDVMSLYQDQAGLLWIGTRGGGVNRWNSRSWELGGNRPAWLGGKTVTAFADAADNRVWIGTLGGGLFKVDPITGEATNLDQLSQVEDALGDRRVMSLHLDHRGNLWIGTWAAGLKKLSSDGKLSSIPFGTNDSHSLSAPGVAVIFESKKGLLWIGTHGGGANVLDPATGIIRRLPFLAGVPGATSSANITSFAEDTSGNIWIGTEDGGVDLANSTGTVLKVFQHDMANPQSLSANTVYAVVTDTHGSIWIATDGGGLNLTLGSSTHPESITFQNFSLSDGLSSDTIYAAVPDSSGQLWLSGNAGLMRLDPETHTIKTYHREHGLQGEEFNSGAYLLTRDGHLCFGGPDGYNIFDPAHLSKESQPPRIALTGLEILGAPVRQALPYWLTESVPLDYRATVVSFDFAALDFTSPNRNRLAYRIKGIADQWIDLNAQRRVTLTNLDAGDHLLEVRAASADSVWSSNPYRLMIHKQAAPWRTNTAYAMYALLLIALALWILRAQRAKLTGALAAKQALESEVAVRTKELSDANQQLIVASDAKSDFLSRMSHELRTPMNGVVGMAELIARSPLSTVQARQIETIRSSAEMLLKILNDLLDVSKAQAGKLELELLPFDLVSLIEECVAIFIGAAESKGLSMIFCPPRNHGHQLVGDSLRLRQILMNLIGNAVKFTEQGEIVVSCDVTQTGAGQAQIKISISDTGIGIAGAAISKIFEPFSQADETTTRRFGGTGLGLSICRQLIVLMGGEISVQSQPRSGSTFTVALPLALGARQADPSLPSFVNKTVIVMTRRRALGESLCRYAELLGATSRLAEPTGHLVLQPGDSIALDADSDPHAVDCLSGGPSQSRLVIIATGAAIEAQKLESKIPDSRLLRSVLSRQAFALALNAVYYPGAEKSANGLQPVASKRFSANVLIVEDDNVNAAVAEGYLAALGCRSTWAKDGLTAISRSTIERFDLILMDLSMPGLDGYETSRHIRQVEAGHRRVPIVALTAHSGTTFRDSCLSAGMDDVLTKPYTFAQCAAVLERWLVHRPGQLGSSPANAAAGALTEVDADCVAQLQGLGNASGSHLYPRLVALFENNSADALTKIHDALLARDFHAARLLAHKLKGAAANVGALNFAAKLGELEQSCTNAPAQAFELYERLALAQPGLLLELGAFTLRASA